MLSNINLNFILGLQNGTGGSGRDLTEVDGPTGVGTVEGERVTSPNDRKKGAESVRLTQGEESRTRERRETDPVGNRVKGTNQGKTVSPESSLVSPGGTVRTDFSEGEGSGT